MQIPSIVQNNIPLAPYTTLGVGGQAEFFCEVPSVSELEDVLAFARTNIYPVTILGGGSNVLVSDKGVRGVVIKMNIQGVSYTQLSENEVAVTVGAGVMLDSFVEELVAKKMWGLENLSAIPGTVGATPIQNVGAYGVEVSDSIIEVSAFNNETSAVENLSHTQCAFGYRDSFFKKSEGKKYIIIAVTFKVSKQANPKLSYKDLTSYFNGESTTDIVQIREAVCAIRAQKFPDYSVVGTAGSFFKNPIISKADYERVLTTYPELPGFLEGEGLVKVSLGWILDKVCSLKGYTDGEIGLYEKQALVLVCTRGVSSEAVKIFSEKIISLVFQKTGIHVEREVTMVE